MNLSDQILNSMNMDTGSIREINQKEQEWHGKRLGRLTSSKFDVMMKTGRSKGDRFSATCMAYIYEKIAEISIQAPHHVSSQAMEWGLDNEPEAIREYERASSQKVESCVHRFFEYGEWAGGTPDGLVGTDGIIEVKCPFNPANHIETLLSEQIPSKYYAQVQGNMMVTNRKWCDFISYDPRQANGMNLVILRIYRDEEFIEMLKERIDEVRIKMQELMERIM